MQSGLGEEMLNIKKCEEEEVAPEVAIIPL